MTFEADFLGALNVSGVTSLVPLTRITATKRIQNGSLPALTFERITSNPVQSIAGDDTGLDQVRMRINCWADDYKEARQIRDAVRVAMRGLTSYFINDQDLYEDDTQIYRVAMDFYVWARVPRSYDLTATSISGGTPVLGTPTLTSDSWTPASLDAGNLRVWYDAQDLSTMFQNSGLSTPVTGASQPLGGWVDKPDGNKQVIQATDGNRLTVNQAGGLYYAESDGVSDILRAATAASWAVMHSSSGCGIYMITKTDGVSGLSYSVGNTVAYNGSSSNVGFRAHIRAGTSERPVAALGNGSTAVFAEGTNNSIPADTVVFGRWENDAAGDVARAQADDSTAGTASLSAFTHSGSTAGALFVSSLTQVCGYYEIVVRSPVLTSDELTELTTYWNGIYGTPIL